MNTRIRALAALSAVAACAAVPAAATADTATPTSVTVRIEGKTKTIFEGAVNTTPHQIDTGDGTGPHKCDGTNGGANSTAGPTATGALDDAVRLAGLTWAGSFSDSFEDFSISRVGPDEQTDKAFWGVAVAGKSLDVGGCQRIVQKGEEVLWAYDFFSKKHLLRAAGKSKAHAGATYKVTVTDTQNGDAPVKGARVGGKKTNAKGVATLRFKTPGTKRVKATKSDSVRSNQLTVKVSKKR
jgi:hypothetical protein